MVGSGSHIYGGVDWVSLGLSAPEHVDLRNPKVCMLTGPFRMLCQGDGMCATAEDSSAHGNVR